jgi:hypothetical protein
MGKSEVFFLNYNPYSYVIVRLGYTYAFLIPSLISCSDACDHWNGILDVVWNDRPGLGLYGMWISESESSTSPVDNIVRTTCIDNSSKAPYIAKSTDIV